MASNAENVSIWWRHHVERSPIFFLPWFINFSQNDIVDPSPWEYHMKNYSIANNHDETSPNIVKHQWIYTYGVIDKNVNVKNFTDLYVSVQHVPSVLFATGIYCSFAISFDDLRESKLYALVLTYPGQINWLMLPLLDKKCYVSHSYIVQHHMVSPGQLYKFVFIEAMEISRVVKIVSYVA